VGRQRWSGAAGNGGGAVGLGRHWGEDEAASGPACRWWRRWLDEEGANRRGRHILVRAPMARRPARLVEEEGGMGRGVGQRSGLGGLGQNQRKIYKWI
jgi:hypothetical protein